MISLADSCITASYFRYEYTALQVMFKPFHIFCLFTFSFLAISARSASQS